MHLCDFASEEAKTRKMDEEVAPWIQLRNYVTKLQSTSLEEKGVMGVGIMSGTSVDGIDVAVVSFGNSSESPFSVLYSTEIEFSNTIRSEILATASNKASTSSLCILNAKLGSVFASAALRALDEAGVAIKDVSFIACHGQTVWHQIASEEGATNATLQVNELFVLVFVFVDVCFTLDWRRGEDSPRNRHYNSIRFQKC